MDLLKITPRTEEDTLRNDNGYQSRKFVISLVAMAVTVVSYIVSNWLTSISSNFGTLVAGIVGIQSAYLGTNVVMKGIAQRIVKKKESTKPTEDIPPDTEVKPPVKKK
jgi:hypothetical protein